MAGLVAANHVLEHNLILRSRASGASKERPECTGSSFEPDCSRNPPQDEGCEREFKKTHHPSPEHALVKHLAVDLAQLTLLDQQEACADGFDEAAVVEDDVQVASASRISDSSCSRPGMSTWLVGSSMR